MTGHSAEPLFSSELSEAQIEELWNEYYPRLRASVAERVRRIRRPVASESEIALSAFNSFIRGLRQGSFADLKDESGLWKLLRTIALRKANDTHKRLWADKRGGKKAPIGQADAEHGVPAPIETAISRDSTADLEVSELFNSLLDSLPNERCRDVILLKLQGGDNATIAECLGTTVRSVQRMLKNAQQMWQQLLIEE